ncbi:hypothetical protein BT63DRAFT_22205 [Microthyrium microscopicum]|uniref:Uncharacterized protein n=1 Tax=Microthyrium microscopicum TaxID=703497 RepID=A0A6A6URE6_9PEZI|nr:hypothetical protein BT63DRAFT_22205 [Microthyrium microscopicum]
MPAAMMTEVQAPDPFAALTVPDVARKVEREVRMEGIPDGASFADVAYHVWGGVLEKLEFTKGEHHAYITFLAEDDCTKYFDQTGNGIQWFKDPSIYLDIVDSDRRIKFGKREQAWLAQGITRAVGCINIPGNVALEHWLYAARDEKRAVQCVWQGQYTNQSGVQRKTLHAVFTNISDAIKFEAYLKMHDHLSECQLAYGPDPIAHQTGPPPLLQ